MAGDYLPESESSVEKQQQSSAAARVTVEQFQGYPTLPIDESDSEIEMTDQLPNPLEAVRTATAATDATEATGEKKVIFHGNVRVRERIPEGEIMEIPETSRWQRWFRQLYSKY